MVISLLLKVHSAIEAIIYRSLIVGNLFLSEQLLLRFFVVFKVGLSPQ
jgi:hypothetical protein